MNKKDLDTLVKLVEIQLTESLGREPTEQELVAKLPLFLHKNVDRSV